MLPAASLTSTQIKSFTAVFVAMVGVFPSPCLVACSWQVFTVAVVPHVRQPLTWISFADSQFPVDISSVKRDHDFLERDLVEPLCRYGLSHLNPPRALF